MYVILRHFVIYSTIQLCVSLEAYSQYLLNLQVFYMIYLKKYQFFKQFTGGLFEVNYLNVRKVC